MVRVVTTETRLQAIEQKLDRLLRLVQQIRTVEVILMANMDDVIAAVNEETTVDDSVVALLEQLTALIKAGQTDPAKIQQALDLINANKQKLADAVVANTPAAPTP